MAAKRPLIQNDCHINVIFWGEVNQQFRRIIRIAHVDNLWPYN